MLTLSRLAVMWCQDKRFQQWANVDGVTAARAFVLEKCGIKSRAELDKSSTAAAAFHRYIRKPFAAFIERRKTDE